MKKSCDIIDISNKINQIAQSMGGVLSYADLSNIIASGSSVQNSRIIARLVKGGVLTKVQRGYYIAQEFDLWLLASRLEPNSYISMDTLLAKETIITTIPQRVVSAVCLNKRKRRIQTPKGDIVYHSLNDDLFFGTVVLKNGVKVATPEKAYLDLLYYYQKGTRYAIDPLSEVNLSKLNKTLLLKYLKKYKNPKFISFVKGLLNEK